MARWRSVLGLLAGIILILSSAAHSLLGGEAVRSQLAAAHVPSDLALGLRVSWHLGGMATLTFGVIVISLFVRRMRGESVSALPALIIAGGEIAFGTWALLTSNFDPFFLIFIVPGLLLAVASARPF